MALYLDLGLKDVAEFPQLFLTFLVVFYWLIMVFKYSDVNSQDLYIRQLLYE